MQKYMADSKVLINLQGLRYVKKTDSTYGGSNGDRYHIEWAHKGQMNSMSYVDKAGRDEMYDKIRQALCPQEQLKEKV